MFEVFLCSSPAHLPLSFACHTWFATNENGIFTRYEVLFQKNKEIGGHFYMRNTEVFEGLEIFPYFKNPKWKGRIITTVSGQLAQKIIEKIKKSKKEYPYTQLYNITGPNSNTYTQWILDKFPEWTTKLPWNTFGSNYK